MIFLRIIGGWFLLAAVIALVYDGTKTLGSGDGEIVMTPLGQHWFNIHAASLNISQAAIERHVAPWLWDPVITSILTTPAWVHDPGFCLLLYGATAQENRYLCQLADS